VTPPFGCTSDVVAQIADCGLDSGQDRPARPYEDEDGPTSHAESAHFGTEFSEIARARHYVRTCLELWKLTGEAGAFELAVSELVTNAITHGSGEIEVTLAVEGPHLRMQVSDDGARATRVRPREGAPDDTGGWGLRLVDHLMDGWGAYRADGRTHVWVQRSVGGLTGR
jgi:anti-sigma regulatory factor (Ser/Thr protein kinase)